MKHRKHDSYTPFFFFFLTSCASAFGRHPFVTPGFHPFSPFSLSFIVRRKLEQPQKPTKKKRLTRQIDRQADKQSNKTPPPPTATFTMDDHPQRQVHLPHPSSRLDHPPHHPHFQAHYRHQQDIHGPLSASVVEGRRAFPFHSSLRSTPLSFSTPAPPSANLSVADILDKYQDANSDFLVSILNAKAKEDEVNGCSSSCSRCT